MIIVRNTREVIKEIDNFYKNMQLATYAINKEDRCVDIALYDDIRVSEEIGKYFGSNSFKSTSICSPQMTEKQLEKVRNELNKLGIKEMALYEPELNKTIYNIGDVIIYDDYSYGKIVDIDRESIPKKGEYPYAVVFPDIYLDDRPYWIANDEIKPVINKEKIKEIDEWYIENKKSIEKDMKEIEEEMES